tara:strand:- start:292 stop:567 length:276 start_codon:yes stop_codon:yes gene_type:complete
VLASSALSKVPPKRKKPPTPSLEQEAKDFIKEKPKEILPDIVPQQESLPAPRELLAASVLSGLLVSGRGQRAEELVEEAYKYVELLLRYNK